MNTNGRLVDSHCAQQKKWEETGPLSGHTAAAQLKRYTQNLEKVMSDITNLRSTIERTARRSIVLFVARWFIGFSIIAVVTMYNRDYLWLWYIAIPIASLSLALTLLYKRLFAKRLAEARSAQNSLTALLVPDGDSLKHLVIGTWIHDSRQDGYRVTGKTTYRSDGTYTSSGSIDAAGDKISFEVSGKWFAKGKSIIWKVNDSTNQNILPIGTTQCDEILSISEAEKTYKDPDGAIWTEQRARSYV